MNNLIYNMSDSIVMRDLKQLMANSFKVECFVAGVSLMKEFGSARRHSVQEHFGVNQYVNGGIITEPEGEKRREIKPGEVFFIKPGYRANTINLAPGKTSCNYIIMAASILDVHDPLSFLEFPMKTSKETASEIAKIHAESMSLAGVKDINILDYLLRRNSIALRLLRLVLEVSVIKPGLKEALVKSERLMPALKYIHRYYQEPLTTRDMAACLHLSEPRFFALFKSVIGLSPGQYLQKVRLKKAQELLAVTEMRVHEIASHVGYEDPFHFSRIFRKNFNISPEQFRKELRS